MVDEKMILGYAKSLRDEYIATATDYGLDHQMTKCLLRDYKALRQMWKALTDRNLSDDIERLPAGEYDCIVAGSIAPTAARKWMVNKRFRGAVR